LAFDERGELRTYNQAAMQILDVELKNMLPNVISNTGETADWRSFAYYDQFAQLRANTAQASPPNQQISKAG
jgi:hypothetical protein